MLENGGFTLLLQLRQKLVHLSNIHLVIRTQFSGAVFQVAPNFHGKRPSIKDSPPQKKIPTKYLTECNGANSFSLTVMLLPQNLLGKIVMHGERCYFRFCGPMHTCFIYVIIIFCTIIHLPQPELSRYCSATTTILPTYCEGSRFGETAEITSKMTLH